MEHIRNDATRRSNSHSPPPPEPCPLCRAIDLAASHVHRNPSLAVVSSLASASVLMMSARSAASVEDYSAAVRGRLAALNRAHELVQPGLADVERPDTRAA